MENKDFYYQQYNKINWPNQEKTKINQKVNQFIIRDIISNKNQSKIKIFDIGFGIGFFLEMLQQSLQNKVILSGCEPSEKNYLYFLRKNLKNITAYNKPFLNIKTNRKFDFITAIYVFPHFISDDIEKVVKEIYFLLNNKGNFVLAVANERYLQEKLEKQENLFLEE